MKQERMSVVNLDEIANRWQVPLERIKYFITDCGMDPSKPEEWGIANWDFLIKEKKKAFEDILFPLDKLRS